MNMHADKPQSSMAQSKLALSKRAQSNCNLTRNFARHNLRHSFTMISVESHAHDVTASLLCLLHAYPIPAPVSACGRLPMPPLCCGSTHHVECAMQPIAHTKSTLCSGVICAASKVKVAGRQRRECGLAPVARKLDMADADHQECPATLRPESAARVTHHCAHTVAIHHLPLGSTRSKDWELRYQQLLLVA
jgi:hypothetical protein